MYEQSQDTEQIVKQHSCVVIVSNIRFTSLLDKSEFPVFFHRSSISFITAGMYRHISFQGIILRRDDINISGTIVNYSIHLAIKSSKMPTDSLCWIPRSWNTLIIFQLSPCRILWSGWSWLCSSCIPSCSLEPIFRKTNCCSCSSVQPNDANWKLAIILV